jgi:hypothetical protein
MAIISDKKMIYEKQLQQLQSQISSESAMEVDSIQAEINHLKSLIAEEDIKMKRYKVSNIQTIQRFILFNLFYS